MEERTVQWVFLRKQDYLRDCLMLKWQKIIGHNFSTPKGIIDIALQMTNDWIHIVELETEIKSASKLDYCVEQTSRYMRLTEDWQRNVTASVLIAEDLTPSSFMKRLRNAGSERGFSVQVYRQSYILELYKHCIEELEKTSGLDIGSPTAMDVCYLYWMNKIVGLFNNGSIEKAHALEKFGSNKTGFNVRTRYSLGYGLIDEEDGLLTLTARGERFREALNPLLADAKGETPLSQEQVSIILEALVDGKITKCKANIFYFLRYIHLTAGRLVPHAKADVPNEYVSVWNMHLGTSYKSSTLTKLLDFTCNQCVELGLVERIMDFKKTPVYSVVLTSLGSRVLGFFELFLHLKREQVTLPIISL